MEEQPAATIKKKAKPGRKPAVKTLEKKKKLTGADVGRLMILDLLSELEQVRNDPAYIPGKTYPGLYTPEERGALVDQIGDAREYGVYESYRSIHDTIMDIPSRYEFFIERFDNVVQRYSFVINRAAMAEDEHVRLFLRPQVMTQKQFDEITQRAKEGKRPRIDYSVGVAIMEADVCQHIKEALDDRGYYVPKPSVLFDHCRVEELENVYGASLDKLQDQIRDYLLDCYSLQEFLKIIADALEIPQLVKIIPMEIDLERLEFVNDQIKWLLGVIERQYPGEYLPDDEATSAVIELATKKLRPLDPQKSLPSPENIQRVRTFVGEDIYRISQRTAFIQAMLKGAVV